MLRIEKLIFEQADQLPEAVAVEHNGERLSYRELKRQALEISRGLRDSGLDAGETVVVFQHRSLSTLPLVLGIWHAGGVVLPVNPNTPVKMLEWIVQDSRPRVIVTDGYLKPRMVEAVEKIHATSAPQILTNSNGHSPRSALGKSIPQTINIDDFSEQPAYKDDCYVIYTSGSEGHPKGVRGSHKSLIQYLR